jgi:hypothetical protein
LSGPKVPQQFDETRGAVHEDLGPLRVRGGDDVGHARQLLAPVGGDLGRALFLAEDLAEDGEARLGVLQDMLAEVDVDDLDAHAVEHLLELDLVGGGLVAGRQQQKVGVEGDDGLGLQCPVGQPAEERQVLHRREFRRIGVEAVLVGGPEVIAPADHLFDGIALDDRRDAIEHPPLAEDHPLDRRIEGDLAPGDVDDGEPVREDRTGEHQPGQCGNGGSVHSSHCQVPRRMLLTRDSET